MQVFDENLDHFDPRNPYAGDDKVPVKFEIQPWQDDAATLEAGRPIFRDTEFIRIYKSKDMVRVRPVEERDKQRWPRQYAAWKNTGANEPGMTGTPLAHLPMISPATAEELRYFKVFTIEQLAGLSDANAINIPGVQRLKQQAATFMMVAKENAPFQQMQDALASRDVKIESQDSEIATLRRELAELAARMPAPPVESEVRR